MKYSKLLNTKSSRSSIARVIATLAVALSVGVVILATIIADGFRKEIEWKTIEVLDNIRIKSASSFFVSDISIELDEQSTKEINEIIAPIEIKGVVEHQALLQAGVNILPTMLSADLDTSTPSGAIVLSKSAARSLGVEVGGTVEVLTIDGGMQSRQYLNVDSIYSSGLGDIESALAYISLSDARKMADIVGSSVSYYAIDKELSTSTYENLYNYADENGLYLESVDERAPHVLGWLDMVDNNISIVLIIMVLVAIINVMTSTLIVMLDNTKILAMLRAVGMSRKAVSGVFILAIGRHTLLGVLYGVLVAVAIGLVQMITGIIPLDSTWYFVSAVPIYFAPIKIIGYLILMVIAIFVSLMVPVAIVSRMDIASSLKYQ